jgi:hypothetical protein
VSAVVAVLLGVSCVVAVGSSAAHAGGHGAAGVVIGLATFAVFAPFIIAGEVLALAVRPYRAPGIGELLEGLLEPIRSPGTPDRLPGS